MFYELNNEEYEKMKKISNITYTDYFTKANNISAEAMKIALFDLLIEYEKIEEKIQDLKDDREENYTPKSINYYIDLGLRESDFH